MRLSTDVFIQAFFALVYAPMIIGRLANLAGRYRVLVMVVLLLIFWSISSLAVNFILIPESTISAIGPALLGIDLVLVVPLVVSNRFLTHLIAKRYAQSVADAIASIIIGSIASFVPPIINIYFSVSLFASYEKVSLIPAKEIAVFPLPVLLAMMGLAIFATASIAWILMGWGSMPTLRRRKGTTLGLVCIVTTVCAFGILTIVLIPILNTLSLLTSSLDTLYFYIVIIQIVGGLGLILGMLTAGFMHGILLGLASLFDFIAFLAVFWVLGQAFGIHSDENGIKIGIAIKFLVLIMALSIIQLRANFVGHEIITTLGVFIIGIPFVGLFGQFPTYIPPPPPDDQFAVIFAESPNHFPIRDTHIWLAMLLFFLLIYCLYIWGVALRNVPRNGYIFRILFRSALIAVPITFLLL